MDRRGRRAPLAAGAVLLAIAAACSQGTSAGGWLDEACVERLDENDCALSGEARVTSGLTEDSVGVELGPGPASLTLMLNAANASNSLIEGLLAVAPGDASSEEERKVIAQVIDDSCPACKDPIRIVNVTETFAWRSLVTEGGFSNAATLRVTGQGAKIQLVALRSTPLGFGSCSLTRPRSTR